jgi:hypothetical protein
MPKSTTRYWSNSSQILLPRVKFIPSNKPFSIKISEYTPLQKLYLLQIIYIYIYIYKFHAIFSPLFQIIIDGRDKNAVDIDGQRLPTLVYMAREKRPQWPHNFKAGAMNALVSFQLKFVHWLSSSYVRYNFFSLSHHSITFY